MQVDVVTEVEIYRPRSEVSAFAADPDNATRWYANIEAVEWRTPPPLAVGTRVAFVARFLARRMSLRNRGRPPGFRSVAGPLMAAAIRRANRKDLAQLKRVLE